MTVNPVPSGYHTVTPYLAVKSASQLIEFLKRAFGATEMSRHALPDGRIMNAVMTIGDSILWLADAPEGRPTKHAQFYLYVPDTDSVYEAALEAGGVSVEKPADVFYGDRRAGIEDPFGNNWWIATHIKEPSPEEIRRAEEPRTKK